MTETRELRLPADLCDAAEKKFEQSSKLLKNCLHSSCATCCAMMQSMRTRRSSGWWKSGYVSSDTCEC